METVRECAKFAELSLLCGPDKLKPQKKWGMNMKASIVHAMALVKKYFGEEDDDFVHLKSLLEMLKQ